ncbi:28S ribosomal protein S9, mitochondrial [Microtus ochrogaster]|uniref:28S ribosomal protein S9, mitochondrial n=1 Tax=Microtus ochrogaster TaxID=79684 RepID=A0A8J6L4M3_MICOH|nr:28S ribosomal protein S9, mitochondrial [Microtus ochrogaster]
MAAPCVSCGRALSRRLSHAVRVSLCQRPGYWTTSATDWQAGPRSQVLKLIHTTVVTSKKNVQASRQESYTEDFIKKQIEDFNIGKRHLANMMGEDPETFTEEDVDEVYGKVLQLEAHRGLLSEKTESKDLIGSRWLIKEELEEMLVEKLSDQDYVQFIRLLEKLLTLPYGPAEEELVQRFRKSVTVQSKKQVIEPVQYDERGMAFSTREGRRKSATAQAMVYEHGSGKIHVNGVDYLLYFPVTQDREQLMFPFHFLDRLEKHDVTCTVSGEATRGRRRLRGLSVMEKREKSRPSVTATTVTATTVTTITITTTITGRRPSHHPASSSISSPRAPPTLSDHFHCIG